MTMIDVADVSPELVKRAIRDGERLRIVSPAGESILVPAAEFDEESVEGKPNLSPERVEQINRVMDERRAKGTVISIRDRESISLVRYPRVREMHLIVEEPSGAVLTLVLESESIPPEETVVRCEGVTELRCSGFGGRTTMITGLYLADISDRGWEGIRWEARDVEDDALAFYARAITFETDAPRSAGENG